MVCVGDGGFEKKKSEKLINFPPAFNQESRFWFLWGNFSLGSLVHIFTQVFLKVTISQFLGFLFDENV